MNTYTLKKVVPGSFVSSDCIGKQLAPINEKLLKDDVLVFHEGESMLIKKGTKALLYRKFEDKFGRKGGYTLAYYHWNPTKTP